jgi:hypothetical protein
MADIHKNLAYVLEKAGVSELQFANDLHARFKTRKDLVEGWLAGRRTPNRDSLGKIASYWSARFPGIEASWFDANPKQFKVLLSVGPEVHRSSQQLGPALSRATRIDPPEGRAVAGVYSIYRRDATRPELVRREVMVIEFRHNEEPQLVCRYLTSSSLFDPRPESYSGYIIPTEQSYYFVGARESAGTQSIAFAILGREPLDDPPVKNGILMSVTSKSGAAFASALIVEKLPSASAPAAAELVSIVRESEVPSHLLERLPRQTLLEPPA